VITITCCLILFATLASRAAAARPIRQVQSEARSWEAVIGLPRAHTRFALQTPRAQRFWRRRLRAVVRYAQHPPRLSDWRCIHHYEGSWRDSGDPYWGGLQMDRSFMRTYAPPILLRRGLANVWSPLEQIWVAERAYRSGRRFYPWPNTARDCGLL
jgi:hypothetical protein